jgi:hypothetical protein
MNINYIIHSVKAQPSVDGYANVITKVIWSISFSQSNIESIASVETVLDFDSQNTSSFIPVEQIDKETIINWVLEKEGGQGFLDILTPIHEAELQRKELESSLVELSLDFVTPFNEIIIPQQNA